jgi:hypothetical protein
MRASHDDDDDVAIDTCVRAASPSPSSSINKRPCLRTLTARRYVHTYTDESACIRISIVAVPFTAFHGHALRASPDDVRRKNAPAGKAGVRLREANVGASIRSLRKRNLARRGTDTERIRDRRKRRDLRASGETLLVNASTRADGSSN